MATEDVLPIKEDMTRNVIAIEPNRTVLEAAKLMAEKRISSLIVTRDERPIGIISEHDIIEKICIKEKVISQVVVGDIMSTAVITADPDTPIEVALQRMTNNRIRRLPVIENEKMIGIVTVTVTDLARHLRKIILLQVMISNTTLY